MGRVSKLRLEQAGLALASLSSWRVENTPSGDPEGWDHMESSFFPESCHKSEVVLGCECHHSLVSSTVKTSVNFLSLY